MGPKLESFCTAKGTINKKKTTHRLGENISKWYDWWGIKIQNLRTDHDA